jgi:hypothetical protein
VLEDDTAGTSEPDVAEQEFQEDEDFEDAKDDEKK